MTRGDDAARHATPQAVLETIRRFEVGDVDLRDFLDRSLEQIQALPSDAPVDLAAVEDAWGEIEITFALAAEAGQSVLDGTQERDLRDSMKRLAGALGGRA